MSKHDAYLACDICNKVVATIKGRFVPRTKAVCEFFNIPRHHITRVFEISGSSYKKTVKEDWCICEDCLSKIVSEIRSNEVRK